MYNIELTFSYNYRNNIPVTKKRKEKGKSIITFPSKFIVLDIETTGLSPIYNDIIEISALKIENDKIVDFYTSLINPNCKIPYDIIQITGITQEMVDTAPIFKEIANNFYEFIGNEIIMGHNVSFDINFLYDNFEKSNLILTNNFIDTMRISRKLHPEKKHHRLKDLIEFYNISVNRQHRALDDCKATFEAYLNMKKEISNAYDELELFTDLFKKDIKNKHKKKIDLTKIEATTTHFDDSHPLFDKVCVFTGKLEKMLRKDAAQLVVNCGGITANTVTNKTNILILGNTDYCKSIKDGKSTKQKKAELLKQQGYDIIVIPEDVFYEMIFDEEVI